MAGGPISLPTQAWKLQPEDSMFLSGGYAPASDSPG